MPIYCFRTPSGETIEHICRVSEKPEYLIDRATGERAYPIISGIAHTPSSWGSEWRRGLSGSAKYDAGLGTMIYDEKQRDALLAARGWIRESDLPKHYVDDQLEAKQQEADALRKEDEYAESVLAELGIDESVEFTPTNNNLKAAERFWEAVMPADKALSEE